MTFPFRLAAIRSSEATEGQTSNATAEASTPNDPPLPICSRSEALAESAPIVTLKSGLAVKTSLTWRVG